jgi:anti-anti-sigma factor
MINKPLQKLLQVIFLMIATLIALTPASAETLTVNVRYNGDITILDLSGDFTVGEGDTEFREAVNNRLAAGDRKFILNFKNLGNMDSSGIGELVSVDMTVVNQGGRLVLISVPQQTYGLLQLTQLISIFEIHDGETDAVQAFSWEK